jgi:putative spermidine/putrescine transport system permease protein
LATPLGTLAAYGLFVSRFRLMRVIYVVLITPLIVPVILIAIAVFYVYVKLGIVNTLTGIVLAHAMLAIPLVIMVVTSALKTFDLVFVMTRGGPGTSTQVPGLQLYTRAFGDGPAIGPHSVQRSL